MYLRITYGHFDATAYDDLIRLTSDIAAAIQRLPGCQDYRAGIDRAGGRTISVSTFDTDAHAHFSRDELGDTLTRMQNVGLRLDPPEFYEVAL